METNPFFQKRTEDALVVVLEKVDSGCENDPNEILIIMAFA